MKMAKSETILSILLILAMLSLVSLGTFAYFNDVEKVGQNVITAGTLDLTVNSQNPCTINITLDNIAPGTPSYDAKRLYKVRNIGTLDGKLSVEFSAITNNDNGLTEPEKVAGDTTGGDGEGELGAYLMINGIFEKIGRATPHDVPLNNVGGHTSTHNLGAGVGDTLILRLWLPSTVGNIIQSDSVEFSITFRLDQVV